MTLGERVHAKPTHQQVNIDDNLKARVTESCAKKQRPSAYQTLRIQQLPRQDATRQTLYTIQQ